MRSSTVRATYYAFAVGSVMLSAISDASASPLNKTIDFTYAVCDEDGTSCLASVRVHNYFSSKGNVFGYEDAASGHKRALGEVFGKNGTQAQFKVAGDSIVFDALNAGVLLRMVITPSGGRCSISASATKNGAPVRVSFRFGACTAYEGHQAY